MRSRFHPMHVPRFWLLALLPLWALVFAISLKVWAVQQDAWLTVFISPVVGDYPVVREVVQGAGVEAAGIQPGDRLISVGTADLKGVGRLEFFARTYEQSGPDLQPPVQIERAGFRHAARLPLLRDELLNVIQGLMSFSFMLVGVLILWRAPDTRLSRLFYLASIAFSANLSNAMGPGPVVQNYVMLASYVVSTTILVPLQLLALMALLEAHSPAPAVRLPRWPWLFLVLLPSPICRVTAWPFAWSTGFVFHFSLTGFAVAVMLFVLFRGYRRTDALGRRRLKWVVYGYAFGLGPFLILALLVTRFPELYWMFMIANPPILLIPISIFFAAVRYQLFDIDRLISATTTYSILAVLLLAGLLLLAPRAAHAVSAVTSLPTSIGQALFSFVLAAMVVPGQRYLRPWLDRMFFAERQALEHGVEHLLRDLSASGSALALMTLAGEKLDALLRPDTCAIYAWAGEAYAPVFARGKAVPPAISMDNALIEALQSGNAALDPSRITADRVSTPVSRAALDSLGAAVLLPIRYRENLGAFICLGYKRSGDIYIGADLALLTAVAHAMSRELQRFDEAELRKQAHAMQESMRRYVPGAIASRLEQGQELEPAAREVTILFVDIRGYTSFSESRSASEIFSMLNRYTEAVSGIVRTHQGAVVEFNGDGLMVVFGAPESIPQKERAAVAAAREVVATIRSMTLGGDQPLDVGIGIATGQAFVGNIQAVDRMIWAAIGNTTNLAARLQALSKDYKASIVIDAATRQAAGNVAADFTTHPNVSIRGRSETQDIFTLRL